MKNQYVVLQLQGGDYLCEQELERLRDAAFDLNINEGQDIEYVRMEHLTGKENCEMCGRSISVFNLAWYPQRDGTFIFNCVDDEACTAKRDKEGFV